MWIRRKIMNVGELIEELKRFPKKIEISISDGFEYKFYSFKDKIPPMHIFDNILDIGIGGFQIEEEDDARR